MYINAKQNPARIYIGETKTSFAYFCGYFTQCIISSSRNL